MLLMFALLVGTTSAFRLTCHCKNGSECATNGFCANGCENGWHGPGCQIGNVALRKVAQQSTTYVDDGDNCTADRAVDGLVPTDNSTRFCTHTYPGSSKTAWWVVTLNETNSYLITNVTIVNRIGTFSNRLANFTILYSNDTKDDPDPRKSTWHECARENGTAGYNGTYTCINTAIAKRVAIYLTSNISGAILTLCELQIYGYEHYECPRGFTGPGCLLRACDQCNLTDENCAGDFGSCRYDVCPDQSFLPPQCWIIVSNPSEINVSSKATCNSVRFSAVLPDTQPNVAASSLLLEVSKTADRQVLINTTLQLLENNSVYYSITDADENTSYNVSVKLEYCFGAHNNCIKSTGSKELTILTGKREYFISHNDSCVYLHANSTNSECEQLSAIEISCKPAAGDGAFLNSSSLPACGLERERAYNCAVTATVNDRKIERYTEYIVTGASSERPPVPPVPEKDISVLAGSIGGSTAVIIVIVVIVFIVYRRQQMNAKFRASRLTLVTKENNQEPVGTLDVKKLQPSFGNERSFDDDEQAYGNMSGMKLPHFEMYVKDEAQVARRFTELQSNEARPCTYGKTPENKGKNRFQNIVPYDVNRVRLTSAANDYINASYINGFSKPKYYIATQGPTLNTMDDFWHMLWQEKCSVIIMLTDYVELAKKKCEKYFPYSHPHGIHFEVAIRSQTVCDTHAVTVLNVRRGSEVQLIHHFHFLAWPDQSVPSHNAEMLLFYNRIALHMKQNPSTGPVVVHCSAGVGRTGAYIAFDYLCQRYQSQSTVDVDSCVVNLRDQRMSMVQTKEQYIFLHRALLYGLKTMRYIHDTSLLPSLACAGTSPSSSVNSNMVTEWQELQAIVPKFDEQSFAAAVLPENKHKNRRSDILALELKRPILSGPDSGDQLYINAVYCNGCYSNRAFLSTQVPLRQTVNDFWLMVYDCNPSCIVLLHDLPTSNDDGGEDCVRYWPDVGHSVTAGWLEVKCDLISKEESAGNARMPGFNIYLCPASRRTTDSQIVSTKLFTTSLWDSKSSVELPTSLNDLLLVANALRTYFVEAPKQPIIVQCRDGATQSGLFLSAVNALHRLIEINQVSVFHTVDMLRASRPEFVTSEAQYRFIYKVLETYCSTLNIYANT